MLWISSWVLTADDQKLFHVDVPNTYLLSIYCPFHCIFRKERILCSVISI